MELNELVKEFNELNVKITELENFLSKNTDIPDRNLALAQFYTMKTYRDILKMRIDALH